MKLTSDLRTLFVAGGAALAVATGTAYALIPDPGGVIQGCYKRSGGTLRVIDAAIETCQANEIALPWNQTGPQGPAGVDGADGAPGISGYEVVVNSVDRGAGFIAGGSQVLCPAGKRPLGGGANVSDPEDDDGGFFSAGLVDGEFPLNGPVAFGWAAGFRRNFDLQTTTLPFRTNVWAICAFVDS